MRGLIKGRWYRQIEDAPDRVQSAGYRAWVDAKALHREPERYHLYVAYACPFAHRIILVRALLGLESALSMSLVHPYLGGPHGWFFGQEPDGPLYEAVTEDHLYGARYLYQIYQRADDTYSGPVTVPVLWDRKLQTIVSLQSADIARMLIDAFTNPAVHLELYPKTLGEPLAMMTDFVIREINAGIYRAGLAQNQADYDRAVRRFFAALDKLEAGLGKRPFLLADTPCFPDLLLLTTLVRFDVAYYSALYINLKTLADYPNLRAHRERLLAIPAVRDTVKLEHYRRHYFDDDVFVNRRRSADGRFIIPAGPCL